MLTVFRHFIFSDIHLPLVIVILLSSMALPSFAEEEDAIIMTRMPHFHSHIIAQEDHTFTRKADWSLQVLDQRALEKNKKTSVSYSTSIEDIEIHHAYTLKVDGTKIEAPENNYQYRSNTGSGGNVPAFSDRSSVTIIFPDVEVGDSVFFAYTITNKQAMFPGYFTSAATYSTAYAYDDVLVILDVPDSFPGFYRTRDMTQKLSKKEGRVVYEWGYKNAQPKRIKRQNYSIWDREVVPGYEYTTFDSYQKIAEAYGARAKPKARVTAEISALADKIVANTDDKKQQARLLYEWVAREISYAGNCIGVGAVVPRDLTFVVENRMGDCKDHATLLEALLTAKGIASTQALINSGTIYQLPEVPMVSSVNHVINYLPDYDLYVDATNQNMPFGLIGFSIADKPVLHVDDFKKGQRTPADVPADNIQEMITDISIAEDGSASLAMSVNIKGRQAAAARAMFRNITDPDRKKVIDNILQAQGFTGSGELKNDDPAGLEAEFSYQVSLQIDRLINRPGAGAFTINPLAFSFMPISTYFDAANADPVRVEISCSNGWSKEQYRITITDSMKLLATPSGIEIDESDIYYKSDYHWENNILTVNREVKDNTHGNRCSPDYISKQQIVGLKALEDLRQQVVYQ